MNSIPNLKDILTFDTIYMQICEELNSSKRSEQILQKLDLASTDQDRIKIIIDQNCNVMENFTENISDQYSPKNQQETEVLIAHFNSCSTIEPLKLRLINKAVRLCPNNPIQSNLLGQNYILEPTLSYFLNLPTEIVKNADNANFVTGGIYLARAKYFHEIGNYENSVLDVFRSLRWGLEKSYDIVLLLGHCYIGLERYNEAISIFRHSLQLLRTNGLDNECKSKETVKVIKILKEIQHKVKSQGQGQVGSTETIEELCSGFSRDEILVLKRFPIFEGKSERLTGSSSVLELRYNEQRGRHIITNKFIPPGATLIVEYPYVWSLNPKNYEKLCQFCMKSAENGVPCPTCSSVIFCNEDCLQQGLNLFHRSECKILKLLICSEKLGNMALLCFRTIIRTPFGVISKEVEKDHSELKNPPSNPGNGRLDSSNYDSVFAQTTNSNGRSGADLLKRSYAAIYLTLCLRYVGYFSRNPPSDNNLNFSAEELLVSAVLLRHLQSVSCNAYGINHASSRPEKFTPLEIEEVGGGSYPIISTTNHSCSPNAYRLNMGKFCIVKSLREIAPGEEVLDSYGPLHTISALEERLSELENQYLFTCSCPACIKDWPPFTVLKNGTTPKKCPNCSGDILTSGISNARKEHVKCGSCGKSIDVKKIQKLYENAHAKYLKAKQEILSSDSVDDKSLRDNARSICEYISSCRKILSNPSKEIIEAQEMLKLLWNIMAILKET